MKNKKYESIFTENTEVSEEVEEKEKETPIPEEPVFEPKTGIVTNCTSLYVRMRPHSNATPVDTLESGKTVKIIGEDGDFYELESPEGFSMKKFIKIV